MTYTQKVAVIVPTKNSSLSLDSCLKSIAGQTYRNIEIIVVDNSSTDSTKQIAKKYTNHVYDHGPERSAQRNYGVSKCSSDYVLIVDSDMELTQSVIADCVAKMVKNTKLKALVIPEESFGQGFWAQCKKLERKFYIGVSWMEAARFFDKQTFASMHGYDELNTGTEDYDLPHRIKNRFGSGVVESIASKILHNEQRLSLKRTCSKKFYYAGKLDVYRSKPANALIFKKQANPFNRYKLFFSRPKLLLHNPIYGLGMLFLKTSELAAGAAGFALSKLNRTAPKTGLYEQ